MIYRDIEQGTDEWHQMRLGKVTASKISDVIAKTKTGYGASRATYIGQLIAERLTNIPTEFYTNAAMQWGTETEPQARAAYEFYTDSEVEQIAFADHPSIDMSGASPDGIVERGLVEIKCPNTATHIEYLTSKKIPKKYINQMQWQMACLGSEWCDFVSFDPRMPEHLNKLIIRVDRDDKYIQMLEDEVKLFNQEINEKLEKLGEQND